MKGKGKKKRTTEKVEDGWDEEWREEGVREVKESIQDKSERNECKSEEEVREEGGISDSKVKTTRPTRPIFAQLPDLLGLS